MYSCIPQFILGFHGCDEKFGELALQSTKTILKKSNNTYDWLGSGIYFWENNPERALDYAKELSKNPLKNRPEINDPFILGTVIDLGKCFNLLNTKYIEYLKLGYKFYIESAKKANKELPTNKNAKGNNDKLIRHLDCAVIDFTLNNFEEEYNIYFDTVRGLFKEGIDIYPDAGFQEKNHIQVSVRNPNCIKGFFRILEPDSKYHLP
jgi:hypothetical protein